ncbi:MAG: hypothetical protein H0V65_06900 [Chitinophagales bacterium]|nr:hypothetical protein [Chitinophagales bacterium]
MRIILLIVSIQQVCAQDQQLVQYSGIVLSTDSASTPVPYTSIYNRAINLGTIANNEGFFTFAARVGDTLEVSSVGYQTGYVRVPEIPAGQGYTAKIFLKLEVETLPETRVYPWFTREQFKDAFVHLNIPDDDLERARKNLNAEKLRELGETVRDGRLSATQSLQNYAYTYYYQGQFRPQAILSPTAWMQFFDALKNGEYKKK